MEGDIRAAQTGQYLQAAAATYHKNADQLHADGNIRYFKKDLAINGRDADISLANDTGVINQTSFQLYSRHARGTAQEANLLGNDITILKSASYTTCDVGDESWLLRSSSVRLDQPNGVGAARNVVLSFKRVPFFYFPYVTFPIDDRRKSGFLPPSYGHSSDNGTEITIPYYINLAPQFDVTLSPRFISKRGTMLNSELRYLTPIDHGRLRLEYLPNDDLTGDDRHLISLEDNARLSTRVSTNVSLSRVSDPEYFRELGNSLSLSSITHLRQIASLDYQTDSWISTVNLESYQTVDETIPANLRPYQRLPQILFKTLTPEDERIINYGLSAEYVDFRNDDRVSGSRLDLQPTIQAPLRTPAAFMIPALTLRHTAYELNAAPSLSTTHPNRTLPIFSMDSGLFLERDSHWGGQDMIHSLEPRLFYLYAPRRDQTEIPLFDTGLPDFNFTQLFRNNRFSGADRVGDANQLSAALTTRFLEKETGQERLRASIGRIFYFENREVSLDSQVTGNDTSDIVAETVASITPKLITRLDMRWNQESRQIDMKNFQLQYMPDTQSIFNIAYRYRETSLEQTDVSFLWPLSAHWHIIGRHNYSLLDERALETLAGLEYQSCCWRTRIVNRRYVNDDLGETRASLYIQFELKGLTSIGDSLESLLEHGILGYEN